MTHHPLFPPPTPSVAPLGSAPAALPRPPAPPPRRPAAASSPAFAAVPLGILPNTSPASASPTAQAETNADNPCTAGDSRSRCLLPSKQTDPSLPQSLSPSRPHRPRDRSRLRLAPYPAVNWLPRTPPPKAGSRDLRRRQSRPLRLVVVLGVERKKTRATPPEVICACTWRLRRFDARWRDDPPAVPRSGQEGVSSPRMRRGRQGTPPYRSDRRRPRASDPVRAQPACRCSRTSPSPALLAPSVA